MQGGGVIGQGGGGGGGGLSQSEEDSGKLWHQKERGGFVWRKCISVEKQPFGSVVVRAVGRGDRCHYKDVRSVFVNENMKLL